MAFSRAQQIKFRILVDKAWLAHCDQECITESTPASKEAWYREQLRKTFKVDSSKLLNKSDEFEKAMALFEELAEAGIYWQLRVVGGDAIRARHVLDETLRNLHLTEEYVTHVAEQAGFRHGFRSYTADELIKLRIMLLQPVRRRQKRHLNPQSERDVSPPE